MKPVEEWTEKDLQALLRDQKEENLRLAFRPREALSRDPDSKERVSRDVSSMANSEGGLIIYGIRSLAGMADRLDPIDNAALPAAWLESLIDSRIQPPIRGLRLLEIPLGRKRDRAAYVADVPRSDRAPHQACDGRYYKRVHAQAVVMEDYEVRDVLGRARLPEVRAQLNLEPVREFGPAHNSERRPRS